MADHKSMTGGEILDAGPDGKLNAEVMDSHAVIRHILEHGR